MSEFEWPEGTEGNLDLGASIELIVLAPKERAARCRVLGTEREITLRSRDVWDMVSGEIVTVRARKQWRYANHPYLSGDRGHGRSVRPPGDLSGLTRRGAYRTLALHRILTRTERATFFC